MGMLESFNRYNGYPAPNNRDVYIDDDQPQEVILGATNQTVFCIRDMEIDDIEEVGTEDSIVLDINIIFQYGITTTIEKTIADIECYQDCGNLFITTTLTPEDTVNLYYKRDLFGQAKITLKDNSVIYSQKVKFKVLPSLQVSSEETDDDDTKETTSL